MTFAAHRRLAAVLLALGLAFGFALVGAGTPAHANSPAISKIYNDTSYATVSGLFHTTWGTWTNLNIGPNSWQGETYGNMAYEPRGVNYGGGWCFQYHYKVAGSAAGQTYTLCSSTNGTLNVYFGDGQTTNYDVHITAVWHQ